MNKRQLGACILALAAAQMFAATPALAATYAEQVVAQLRAQGFEAIRVERTLLGRTRIAADRADGSREIVLNPNTGEILRDLWTSTSGDTFKRITIGNDTSSEDDNGGHGSGSDDEGGNSGHGGGEDGGGEDGGGDDAGRGGDD